MKALGNTLALVSALSTLIAGVQGATITLYNVIPTSSPTTTQSGPGTPSFELSYSASPVSTRDDGKTVYQEVLVITKDVIPLGSSTTTLTSGLPQTLTRTLVEDSNGFEQTITAGPSGVPFVVVPSCSFQGTTRGVCVYNNAVGPSDHRTTTASTFTGTLTPVFTITQSSGASYRWDAGGAAVGSAFSLLLTLATMAVMSATVTLYGVRPTATTQEFLSLGESVSFSFLSVNPDGRTAYAEIDVVTEEVRIISPIFSGESTSTLTSIFPTPITATQTMVQDSNGFEYHLTHTDTSVDPPVEVVDNKCSFQGTTRAICVDSMSQSGAGNGQNAVIVTTMTGIPTPIFTLIESQTQAPTQPSNAALPRANFGAVWGVSCVWGLIAGVMGVRLAGGL
ncbi:hypothetical protein NP233_g3468 [Leucocoprinus birnbaumii]|uniref:Uncharacterized protein n=1 Tax=Leucocoprinus birnbaumii TaxID=56174 RepID=A0AAD5VWF1_9AGAR|nr:hypothetical protein NP233_g3468 [Leucocoprinus birnbaumii]